MNQKEELAAWTTAPLPDLVRHIVGTCHLECRMDLDRLEHIGVLMSLDPDLRSKNFQEIRELIIRFVRETREHLAMEEQNLFPVILGLEPVGGTGAPKEYLVFFCQRLQKEHEMVAEFLRYIRGLTNAKATPENAESPLALIPGAVKVLAVHLQKHLYLESQILFPRVKGA